MTVKYPVFFWGKANIFTSVKHLRHERVVNNKRTSFDEKLNAFSVLCPALECSVRQFFHASFDKHT